MASVKCKRCGETVDSRGMSSHRGGAWCLVTATLREQAFDGYSPVLVRYETILKKCKVPYRYLPCKYDPGFEGRPSRLIRGCYVPDEVANAIKERTHGVETLYGRVQMSLKGMQMGILAAMEDFHKRRSAPCTDTTGEDAAPPE